MEATTKRYKLRAEHKKFLADTNTPVGIYLKLRDHYANSILLESSDYHGNENSFSYICCDPVASFQVSGQNSTRKYPDGVIEQINVGKSGEDAVELLSEFSQCFEVEDHGFKFINNGLFGYMSYDAVQHFEDISFDDNKPDQYQIPDIQYNVYRYIIVIDHFKDELYVFDYFSNNGSVGDKGLDHIISLINSQNYPTYNFQIQGSEETNYDDAAFLEIVEKGIGHCLRGDVFQIVLSRQFKRQFRGDEFNVYRCLRSINPSPYLFYFDYGSFKIFGSSPEAQIVIRNGTASIYPIAGTFKRTGDDAADAEIAKRLYDDPKENSEHVMLVDLARNDLSRNGEGVNVDTFKEIQYYSHVIHLVSKVTGKLASHVSPIRMVADTFPAGTLSGAPKYKALELIDKYENTRRGYYGGAIGFLGFNGDFNHAIMIRSFLSKDSVLYYQAGAGIVAKSKSENELQEVDNKLMALRQALVTAEKLSS